MTNRLSDDCLASVCRVKFIIALKQAARFRPGKYLVSIRLTWRFWMSGCQGKQGELLPKLRVCYPDLPLIMATAVDDAATAISCLKEGAYDYLIKPFNLEEVALSVSRALENSRLKTENRDYQLNLETKVREQTAKIRESFLNSIQALALALEAKDEYTSDHSRRVAAIAVRICKKLGMTDEETEKVRVAGLVHDIGKIGIKEASLNKPGTLTEDEDRQVQSHPRVAASMLIPIVDDSQIIDSIVHHHERFDGSGYPDKLAGERIPRGPEYWPWPMLMMQ